MNFQSDSGWLLMKWEPLIYNSEMCVLKNRNKRKTYAGNIWYFRGMGGTPHSDYVKNNGILKICTVKERETVCTVRTNTWKWFGRVEKKWWNTKKKKKKNFPVGHVWGRGRGGSWSFGKIRLESVWNIRLKSVWKIWLFWGWNLENLGWNNVMKIHKVWNIQKQMQMKSLIKLDVPFRNQLLNFKGKFGDVYALPTS